MTNFTRMMIAAATMAAAVGAASAQTMKAEIPFTFRVGNAVMRAGTYQVSVTYSMTGTPMLYLHTWEGNKAVLARAEETHDAPRAWRAAGNPVLAFQCGISRCSLAEAWDGKRPAFQFAAPKLGRDEPTRMAVVALQPGGGE